MFGAFLRTYMKEGGRKFSRVGNWHRRLAFATSSVVVMADNNRRHYFLCGCEDERIAISRR